MTTPHHSVCDHCGGSGMKSAVSCDPCPACNGRLPAVPSLPVPDPPDDVREHIARSLAPKPNGWDWSPDSTHAAVRQMRAAATGVLRDLARCGAVVVFAEGLPMGARLEPAADPDCELCEGTNAVEDANGDCFDCRPCMDTPTMFRRVLTDKEPR